MKVPLNSKVLTGDGSIKTIDSLVSQYPHTWLREALMGLASKMSLGFPTDKTFFIGQPSSYMTAGNGYMFQSYESSGPVADNYNFYQVMSSILNGVYLNDYRVKFLSDTGLEYPAGWLSSVNASRSGFMGLAHILRGDVYSTVSGSLLNYADLTSTSFSANNLLSAFSPILDIQNDVARLAHIIADPTEQALHDANKDNVQAVTDNLTGEKGVSSHDIGDLSGISSSLGDSLNTGVGVGDLTGQLGDSSHFGFYSQEVDNALHNFPSVTAEEDDEDFVHFYDPENKEFFDLIGEGSK